MPLFFGLVLVRTAQRAEQVTAPATFCNGPGKGVPAVQRIVIAPSNSKLKRMASVAAIALVAAMISVAIAEARPGGGGGGGPKFSGGGMHRFSGGGGPKFSGGGMHRFSGGGGLKSAGGLKWSRGWMWGKKAAGGLKSMGCFSARYDSKTSLGTMTSIAE